MPVGDSQLFVGLMSGTSADGIDAVAATISGRKVGLKVELIAHFHRPFSPRLRGRILHTSLHGTVDEICELNFLLGEHFAQAALAVIRKSKLEPKRITAIGSHGQTIHHLPRARTPSTLQIGEPAVIAETTGITTIADFRVSDMAAGGQGAPLVPYADWVLFSHHTNPRIIQNIGGIANLTFLPAGARLKDVVAFDTGPGNMVIDAVVNRLSHGRKTFDRNGNWAKHGKISEALLARLLAHPFLLRRPPKTTGREEFGEAFVEWFFSSAASLRLSEADLVATATAFTAETIADAYARYIFSMLSLKELGKLEVILGGGGAENPELRRMLFQCISQKSKLVREPQRPLLLTHHDFEIPNSAKEALAFAILARETLHGRTGNIPKATGASHAVVLGKLIPGRVVRRLNLGAG